MHIFSTLNSINFNCWNSLSTNKNILTCEKEVKYISSPKPKIYGWAYNIKQTDTHVSIKLHVHNHIILFHVDKNLLLTIYMQTNTFSNRNIIKTWGMLPHMLLSMVEINVNSLYHLVIIKKWIFPGWNEC